MKIRKNSLVLAAAFTGLLGGTMARLNAAPASGCILSAVSAGSGQLSTTRRMTEKHACKGRTPARARAAASPATTGAKARTPARVRAAAPPTVPRSSKTVRVGGRRQRCARSLFLKHMPANRFNGFTDYGIGIGLRIPHYAAHLRKEARGRLVRDHLGKLHGRRRASAGDSGPDPRTLSRRSARRVDVFRLGGAAEPGASCGA